MGARGASVKHERLSAHAIILAGGRGTRFWPRSRTRTPKQLLNIVGRETMLEQTVARLAPLFPASRQWVVTNSEQAAAVRKQLPRVPASHILAEPVGRNTAAAIGLGAAHLLHGGMGKESDALMAVLPADHYISQPARYLKIARAALHVAHAAGALVVLGIPPSRPETGYGYIERARGKGLDAESFPVFSVRRFTEKPALALARKYVSSGRYYWNAGMFFWRVSTFLGNLEKFLPKTHDALMRLAGEIGTPATRALLRKFIRSSKTFPSTTRSLNRPLAAAWRQASSSCPPRSAGATSAPGPPFMNCSRARLEKMSLPENMWRLTRKETFSGVQRNLLPRLGFATSSSSKPRTPCCSARATVRRRWQDCEAAGSGETFTLAVSYSSNTKTWIRSSLARS